MKILNLLFLVALLALSSCVSSDGEYDTDNKSTEPMVFTSALPMDSAVIIIKKVFAEQNYFVKQYDSSIGLLLTEPKLLNSDEKYSSWMISNAVQYGFAKLMFTKESMIIIKLNCYLTYKISYSENMFKNNTIESDILFLPQGHPFITKIKKLILKTKYFKLQ